MKWLIIVFLVLASSAFADQAKPTGTKDGSAKDAAKSTSKESKELNIPSQSAPQNPPNSVPSKEPSQTIANNSSTDPPDWINYVNAWSTLVIAFFTALLFIGLVIQIRTSRAIERAWIMAEVQTDSKKPGNGRLAVFEGSGTNGESTAAMNAVLNCGNAGKTPGWIEETISKFEMVKTLPDTPNFESAQYVQRSTIPLGMTEGGALPHTQEIPWMPIAEGHQHIDEMAVIYGRVTYRDVFGRKHITTFGYKVRPHGRLERLEGHPKYNKNS